MRSVDSNVVVLFPSIAFVFAIVLLIIDRERLDSQAASIRLAVLPITAWAAFLTLANSEAMKYLEWPLVPGYQVSILPAIGAATKASFANQIVADPRILRLRNRIGALSTDRYVIYALPPAPVLQSMPGEDFFEPRPFLPASPTNMFDQLSPERRTQIVSRYLERHSVDGWLLSQSPVNCNYYVPGSGSGLAASADGWHIEYCNATRHNNLESFARPRPLTDTAKRLFGSFDEVYFGDKPAYVTEHTPIDIAKDQPFWVRGWIVNTDATPFRGRMQAVVDGTVRAQVSYGDARPDVPLYMSARRAGTYPPDSGFSRPDRDSRTFARHSSIAI